MEKPDLVSTFSTDSVAIDSLETNDFKAGRLKEFLDEWKKITSDRFILDMVKGSFIPIEKIDDLRDLKSKNYVIPGHQHKIVDKEIAKLLELEVIELSNYENDQITSPIFLVPKTDGSYRMILDLKEFNKNVEYEHFKMENLNTALLMVTKDCYMASVDLRHAYYSVPIKKEYRKYLKFIWKGKLFQYTCFPNGLSCCPRFFTKLLKPVYANLRAQGFLSTSFIDDSFLLGNTNVECQENVVNTVKMFEKLGFFVHREKSVFTPTQRLRYLGFIIDSKNMTVELTEDRKRKLRESCLHILEAKRIRIRQLAQVIGQIVASFPGVEFGQLYYRDLEKLKIEALRKTKGDFDGKICINQESKVELHWWKDNIDTANNKINRKSPEILITSDASLSGWGAVLDQTINAGGRWNETEKIKFGENINALELLAVFLALQSFEKHVVHKHVKVLSDNMTTVNYISHMGGVKSNMCNEIAKQIWFWCYERNIWITISHLAGKLNTQADQNSRIFKDATEWQLDPKIFERLVTYHKVDIDLFASRLNFQIKPYFSWLPDPSCEGVDAFTFNWNVWDNIYCFPPFSLILRCLQKWKREGCRGILVAPLWPTAPWFPVALQMVYKNPVLLPRGPTVLRLSHSQDPHPLHKKLNLVGFFLSGRELDNKTFLEQQKTLSLNHGEKLLGNHMKLTYPNGKSFAVGKNMIHFLPM